MQGYTIPLDKRLAADGRGLQEVAINDTFAKLSEALYIAEQKAREAVEMRSKIQRELLAKEKERKERELRELAMKVRLGFLMPWCILGVFSLLAAHQLAYTLSCSQSGTDLTLHFCVQVIRARIDRLLVILSAFDQSMHELAYKPMIAYAAQARLDRTGMAAGPASARAEGAAPAARAADEGRGGRRRR